MPVEPGLLKFASPPEKFYEPQQNIRIWKMRSANLLAAARSFSAHPSS
jgi:hypothetical protein